MRISPTIHSTYGNTLSTRATMLPKKTTSVVPEFKMQLQVKEVNDTSENVMPIKRNLDSGLSEIQRDKEIRTISGDIACADGFQSVDEPIFEDAYTHYEKANSIYDIPYSELDSRMQEAMSKSSSLNTDGATKLEIFNRVKSIFSEYLGKDFLEPSIIYGSASVLSFSQNAFPTNNYQFIHNNFNSVLHKLGVTLMDDDGCYDPSVIIEAKGYTGMSESEMRTAVRDQYPENMTLKDCILMSNELGRLGLETSDYGRAVVDNIFTTLAVNSGANANTAACAIKSKKVFDAMLKMPADFDKMKQSIESNRGPGGNIVFDYKITSSKDEILKDLLTWFGGSKLYGTDLVDGLMKML